MLKNRKYTLYYRIIIKRSIVAVLAFSLALVLWLSLRPSSEKAIAGINVTGDGKIVTFGSGYYTVDSEGKVYKKDGSVIADTPDTLESYSYVSYLSTPFMYNSSQLELGSETDVIVQTGANLLLEGSQHYKSLTLNGGIISQPQSNREGKINAYQYSDQEWAIEFITYLKVGPTEKRKVTCPQTYYTSRLGNGCSVEYSPTFFDGNSISSVNNWTVIDKIWQTDATNFDQNRYSDNPGALMDNDSGVDRYYPIRIRFKNDDRNEKNEIMRVVLRDDTNTIIGNESGIDLNLLTGFNDEEELDTSELKKAEFNYYLRDSYLETSASHTLGWISGDLSNAYITYTNPEIDIDTFFNGGYGKVTDGIFDLCFDDNTNISTYSETYASSPFSKGTSTVYSTEVYHNYTRSAKTINPNITAGNPERYIDAGVDLVVTNDIIFNGGNIDLSGKGYAGYDGELRRGDDGNPFTNNRAGGYNSDLGSAGGLSSDKVPQSAAHAGSGGGGQYYNDTRIYKNANYYGSSAYSNTLGSGGGSSHYLGDEPTIGGSGGGKIQIRASNVNFNNALSTIKVTGGDGNAIKSNSQNYYAGGSGGSVFISANNVNVNYTQVVGQYIFIAKGGYQATSTISSEGSGGYVKIVTTNFNFKGTASHEDKLREFIDSNSRFSASTYYSGSNGSSFLDLGSIPQAINTDNKTLTQSLLSENRSALYPQLNEPSNDSKIFANEDMNLEINVQGMDDIASFRRKPIDLIIVSDLYALNSDDRELNLRTALKNLLMQIADINRQYPRSMRVAITGIWSEGSGENIENQVQTFTRGSGSGAYNFIDSSDIIAGLDENGDPLPHTMAYEVMHYSSKDLASGTSFGSGLEEAMRIIGREKRNVAQQYILFISPFNELYSPCISRIGETTCENYTIPLLDNTIAKNIKDNGVNLIHTAYFGKTISNKNKGIIRKKFQDITNNIRSNSLSPKIKTYYETSSTSDLSNTISPILDNISGISSGMAIKIQQKFPPGVKILSEPKLEGKKDDTYSCSSSNEQISCVIYPTAYSADRDYILDPNDEIFKFNVKLNFADVDPGWIDTQSNKNCGADGSETTPILGSPHSFVEYLPSGLYTGNTIKISPSSCRQIIPNIISGDVYNSDSYLKNFAFYGNNLNQSNDVASGVGSSWEIENYSTNPLSQISNFGDYYESKIATMQGEAQPITANNTNLYPNWYLQGNDLSNTANSQAESLLQGKSWKIDTRLDLGGGNYTSVHNYYGQGTIIINGNLTLRQGVKIVKGNIGEPYNNLGLIVNGDLILEGDNELEASVYVRDSVKVMAKNIKILGSIAAGDFKGFDTFGKLDIRYDYKTEDKWPPGFRYLSFSINNNSAQ